jgi:hypothetical protein
MEVAVGCSLSLKIEEFLASKLFPMDKVIDLSIE